MDNIVTFPGDTSAPIGVRDVLSGEKANKAEQVLVLGTDEDGEFFMCMSDGAVGPNLVLVELAQRVFLRALETHYGLS
jgi:hypothetical protein